MTRLQSTRIFALTMGLLIASCEEEDDEKKGKVTTQLQRVTASEALLPSSLLEAESLPVSSALTIDSLKVPITHVTLDGADGTGSVYTCASDCLVELTGTALQDLLTTAEQEITEGTYTTVTVGTCTSGTTYEAKITATGTLGGVTYYTQAGSSELTTDESLSGEATVYFSGCSRNYPLPTPVTVSEGTPVDLKLYFDIADIAFFGDGSNSSASQAAYAGGSSYPYDPNAAPTTTFVGVNYLDVAATVDAGTPTVSRFRIETDTSGTVTQATMGFFYTSSGHYFGGYTRSYFSSSSTQGHNSFVTPIRIFTESSTGIYQVENYGSTADSSYVVFSAFEMGTHDGELTIQGQAGTYTAEAL